MTAFLKSAVPHIIAVSLGVIISIAYFHPQLSGKKIPQGDYLTYQGMAQEVLSYEEEHGRRPLWTNSMFGGMPTYQIASKQSNNLIVHIKNLLFLGFDRPAGFFIMGFICFYILLVSMGVSSWLSLVGAFCFSFTTNNVVLYEAGHVTKLMTIMVSPLILAGVLFVFRKKYILGAAIFGIGFALNMTFNHFQMTYYLGILIGILCLMTWYQFLKEKDTKHIMISAGILFGGILLGAGCTASKLWTTYEYGEDTMRGQPILEKTDGFSSSSSEGLSFEYAMNWSNGTEDLLASFIPLVVGGSSGEKTSKSSKLIKDLRRKGLNVRPGEKMPLYWGSLPSTSGPIYFGAIVFFLFVLSLITLKGALKWWGLAATILTFMWSMGSNIEWFNRLFFDYFPFYNKFRTPNSVLSVTAMIIPLLGIYGLHKYLTSDKPDLKKLYIATGSMVAITGLIALLGPSLFDMTSSGDARYQGTFNMDALIEDRASMMRSSAFRSMFLILIAAASIYLNIKGKLKSLAVIGVIGVLCLYDLIGTNLRYIDSSDFISERSYDSNFELRPVDKQILADPNPYYRVHDLTISSYMSSSSSYHHKTIGGMHAAKLQRIQDLIDLHIQKGNQKVLNMLNTRYYIIPGADNQAVAQMNPAALGNAWFVNSFRIVNSANEEIQALEQFDPAGEAIVHKEFSSYVNGLDLQKEGRIELTEYAPDKLSYRSNSGRDQLAVFSEMWYGPDKGWQAYIDGSPVDHIRVNYALRGLKIPAGSHEIIFEFKPSSYYTGEIISLIASLILIGLTIFGLYKSFKKNVSS